MAVAASSVIRWLRSYAVSIWGVAVIAVGMFAVFAVLFLLSALLKVYARKKGATYDIYS